MELEEIDFVFKRDKMWSRCFWVSIHNGIKMSISEEENEKSFFAAVHSVGVH